MQSALQYVNNFQQPFTTISQMSGQLSSAMAAGERIFALLDAEEEIPDPENGKVPTNCDGSVEFKHVQFGCTRDPVYGERRHQGSGQPRDADGAERKVRGALQQPVRLSA